MGAETVVDVWLHVDKSRQTSAAGNDASDQPAVAKVDPETRSKLKLKSEIKVEPEDASTKKENLASTTTNDADVQTTFIRCKGKEGGSFLLPVTVLPKNCQKRVDWNLPLQPQRQLSHQLRLSVELPTQQQQHQQQLQQQTKKKNGVSVLNGIKGRDGSGGNSSSCR